MPSLPVQEKIFGPKPMENRVTFTPRQRAARKWPSSWTKIDPPKNRTTRKIDQMLDSSVGRRSEDIEG